jgi:hypothetical protein
MLAEEINLSGRARRALGGEMNRVSITIRRFDRATEGHDLLPFGPFDASEAARILKDGGFVPVPLVEENGRWRLVGEDEHDRAVAIVQLLTLRSPEEIASVIA